MEKIWVLEGHNLEESFDTYLTDMNITCPDVEPQMLETVVEPSQS